MKSFADPDTRFEIVTSSTPPTVDGFAMNEPTGEVRCLACGQQHANIDEIPHDADCPQRFVHSRWYTGCCLDAD